MLSRLLSAVHAQGSLGGQALSSATAAAAATAFVQTTAATATASAWSDRAWRGHATVSGPCPAAATPTPPAHNHSSGTAPPPLLQAHAAAAHAAAAHAGHAACSMQPTTATSTFPAPPTQLQHAARLPDKQTHSTGLQTPGMAGGRPGQQRGAATTACDIQDRELLIKKGPSGAPPVLVIRAPANPLENKRLGFIGSGQMAEALTRGLLNRELVDASQVSCSDPSVQRKQLFQSLGACAYESNADVVRSCDILFIAVKPAMVGPVLREVRPMLTPHHTIVSIAAGVTLAAMTEAAGPEARVVRVMPNTPCLVGETAAAMCLGGRADSGDEAIVRQLFEAVGRIYTVDEKLLSAVTGLSGSGPAYVFMVIEALADGGVRAGLPRDVAQALAAQTVLGAARMVLDTSRHPGALKDQVASPGGTTIAGVHVLERAGMRAAFMDAVVAATVRADELSSGQ